MAGIVLRTSKLPESTSVSAPSVVAIRILTASVPSRFHAGHHTQTCNVKATSQRACDRASGSSAMPDVRATSTSSREGPPSGPLQRPYGYREGPDTSGDTCASTVYDRWRRNHCAMALLYPRRRHAVAAANQSQHRKTAWQGWRLPGASTGGTWISQR